ncbi:MAG TPA: molybdenum cofactor guanylyltransferase [Pyrinomonadaceae bacterium]|jgi:molybdopterin-guanine dinucleotide biosynthesis protein A|nr:molybdenum cofactor guanylyltransferase [Pyrinomonadaceae bacterium]
METEGFILAGGASSRMGEDKSRLELGGRTFVEAAAVALRAVATRVSVVSSRAGAGSHGLPVVEDLRVGVGALGGLHAALASCRAEWAAVVACDLPFVTGELVARLASMLSDETDAVVPLQDDGRVQPLCALYRARVCLGQVEEMIRAGELRPRVLLSRVRARLVAFGELRDLKGSARFFVNVNTPEDYARAVDEGGVHKTGRAPQQK